MLMSEAYKFLRRLEKGERRAIYMGKDGTKVLAIRTDKICPNDFAVALLIPGREEFRPTHVRLLFDLYLKRLSNLKDSTKVFYALEKVYDGEDPEKLSSEVLKLKFPMQLDNVDVNLYYTQLLMIEQEFNYGPEGCKKGNVEPPREFLMRFIRWVASGNDELDRIISVAVRNFPPPKKYAQRIDCV